MAEERIFYESFVGHIELREGIIRRDVFVLERALFIRNAIGALAAIFAVLRLVDLSSEMRGLDWVTRHGAPISVGLVVSLLFASANIWFARERLKDSRADLVEYIGRLPIPEESVQQCGDESFRLERGDLVA